VVHVDNDTEENLSLGHVLTPIDFLVRSLVFLPQINKYFLLIRDSVATIMDFELILCATGTVENSEWSEEKITIYHYSR
jgi:hypothetical protein